MNEIGPFGSRTATASPSTRLNVPAAAVPQETVVVAPVVGLRRPMVPRRPPAEVSPEDAHRSAAVTAVVWYGTANQSVPMLPFPESGTLIERDGLCEPTMMIEVVPTMVFGRRMRMPRPGVMASEVAPGVPQVTAVDAPETGLMS